MTAARNIKSAREASSKRRMGSPGWARVLCALTRPMTASELALEVGVNANCLRSVLRRWLEAGIIHVSHWERRYRQETACYRIGRGSNAPHPTLGDNFLRAVRPRNMPNTTAFITLVKVLMDHDPQSVLQLVEHTGMARGSVNRVLKALRQGGALRVSWWDCRVGIGGPPTPSYNIAPGEPDAPKPRPLGQKLVDRMFQQRQTAKRRHLRMLRATAGIAQRDLLAA